MQRNTRNNPSESQNFTSKLSPSRSIEITEQSLNTCPSVINSDFYAVNSRYLNENETSERNSPRELIVLNSRDSDYRLSLPDGGIEESRVPHKNSPLPPTNRRLDIAFLSVVGCLNLPTDSIVTKKIMRAFLRLFPLLREQR